MRIACHSASLNCGLLSSFPFELSNGTTVALALSELCKIAETVNRQRGQITASAGGNAIKAIEKSRSG
jgi:hypothetical protein